LLAFYVSISLTIVSNNFYHTIQKLTPSNVNPILTLSVTYASATLLYLFAFPLLRSGMGFLEELQKFSWTSVALGITIAGIEAVYLCAYREDWNISKGALTSYVSVDIILLLIGLIFFKEKVSLTNLMGVCACLIGLILLHQNQAEQDYKQHNTIIHHVITWRK
jgi:EamA domain-containing membrane protein RarD